MTEEESSQRLRQLLRLKRQEAPPPGYFREFSGGVMDRIRAIEAERSRSVWHRWFSGGSRRVLVGDDERATPWIPWFPWANAGAVAAMVAAVGGWYWIDRSTDNGAVAEASGVGNPTGKVASVPAGRPAAPAVSLGPEVAEIGTWRRLESSGGPGSSPTDNTLFAGRSSAGQNLLVANGRPLWATNARASQTRPGFSSTNPLPEGLFRLPDGSGTETYRVRFTGPSN